MRGLMSITPRLPITWPSLDICSMNERQQGGRLARPQLRVASKVQQRRQAFAVGRGWPAELVIASRSTPARDFAGAGVVDSKQTLLRQICQPNQLANAHTNWRQQAVQQAVQQRTSGAPM